MKHSRDTLIRISREISKSMISLADRVESLRIRNWDDLTTEEDHELNGITEKLKDLARKRVGTF